MSVADDVLVANAQGASRFQAGLAAAPGRHVAVVTCMDARIDVYAVLGLRPGDAHVLRNAGGLVTDDVERSLAVSQRSLGTREVLLVHHSGCGLIGGDEAAFAAGLPSPPPWRVGFFADVEADVRAGLMRLRSSPYLPHTDAIRGFVLDVETGRLTEVT